MKYRTVATLTVGAIALVSLAHAASPDPEPAAQPAAATSKTDSAWKGAGSCALTACHGDTGGSVKRGEYTTWAAKDPHARAYQVLFEPRSVQIVANLPDLKGKRPHEAQRCLDCHATNPPDDGRGGHLAPEDGVACESCHGPAERWRTEHYQASWRWKTTAEKEALGMRPTKDLAVRARVCAECHIGSGGKDVNHDLIAAGHPRLNFEFGLFTAKMPKHWSMAEEKARHPDFEARVWVIGQVASAEAALRLLADRAQGAVEMKRPWPEFAEYACASCHHHLGEDSGYRASGLIGGQGRGSSPWGAWYYTLLAEALGESGHDRLPPGLARLHEAMGKLSPDPAAVAREAREVAGELRARGRELATDRYEPDRLDRLLRAVSRGDARRPPAGWDEAAQEYLAIAALYNGLTDLEPRRRDLSLRASINALLGPLEPTPGYGSPIRFDVQSFQRQMESIQSRLAGR